MGGKVKGHRLLNVVATLIAAARPSGHEGLGNFNLAGLVVLAAILWHD